MTDNSLTPEQFQALFSLPENDYRQQAPDWLRRVQQPVSTTPSSTQELLSQLQSFQKTNRRLEQVLVNSNVPLPTDIPFGEAKQKVTEINALLATCTDPNEYQQLAVELDKYTGALMASDEYQLELQQKERDWEQTNRADNDVALRAVRRHMPVNIRSCSEAALVDDYDLPKPLARKFIRTNVLQLLRKSPTDVEKMHPSSLEGLKTTGLTLTERRALYLHMLPLQANWSKAKDAMTERKMTWYNMMKTKFQESLGQYQQHAQQHGTPTPSHKCNLIGNQCPFKADIGAMDYYSSRGYGFPPGDVYEQSEQAATVKLATTTPSLPSPLSRSLSMSARPRPPTFLGELANSTLQCAPAASGSGEANRPLLSEVVNQGPVLAAKRQESIARRPPEPTRSRKNLLDALEGKKSAMPAAAAASPAMGGLLAGLANMKLKKTEGPKEKVSLIKEVAAGTKPTIQPVVAPAPPPAAPSTPVAQQKPATRKERRTSVTSVVVLDDAGERLLALKQHYLKIDKMSQIEEARVSCESLEEAMDQLEHDLEQYVYWQLLDTDDMLSESERDKQIEAFRTTLQKLEGAVTKLNKRVYSSIGDDRSLIEVELVEDLYKMISSAVVFILTRGKELKKKDKGIRDLVVSINSKMQGIHSNNELALKKLGEEATSTRKVRTVAHITEKKKSCLSLQERSAIRAAGLERHYGKGKTANAAVLCDNLDAAMDRFDSYMDGWVDQMILTDDTKTSDAEKEKLLGYYRVALEGLKIPVKELTERATSTSYSKTECEMAEDLYRLSSCVFNFIMQRMKKLDVKDKVIKKLLRELNEDIKAVHDKNLATLKSLKVEAHPTRKVRSVKQIIEAKAAEKEKKTKKVVKKVVKKIKQEVIEVPVTPTGTPKRAASISSLSRVPASLPVPPPPVPPSPKTPTKELVIPDVVGRDQLKWQLLKQVDDAVRMKRKLEKAITNNGLTIPDEKIGYEEAERKMTEISQRMQEVGHKHPEYFTLEQQMEKYQSALLASDEYQRVIKRREKEWEDMVAPDNQKALVKLRRHMPVNIRNISEAALSSTPTPNGKTLPAAIVKKLKRTNVLQLIRLSPEYIENVHFANLEGMSLSGLTLTENRALYEHIRVLGPKWERARKDKSIERKFMWYQLVRNKLKQALQQSSVKEIISYEDDYGFPTGAVYEVLEVAKEDIEKYQRRDDEY